VFANHCFAGQPYVFFERRVVSHPFSRRTRLTLILAPDRL
jgi:hypothetical protein